MASLFGDAGLWDAAASSLFFTETEVDRLLNAGEPTLSVEGLLGADSVIQDTQAQAPRLLEYWNRGSSLDRVLFYLTVPQDTSNQDAAYRFPYMACEVLACAVRSMLATLTDRRAHHMRTLFAAVAPQLVADAARDAPTWLGSLPPDHAAALRSLAADMAAAGGFDAAALPLRAEMLRPYLAGYWSKVVGVLCRVRPADMVRFLLRTPGVGQALVANIYNGSVAGTLAAVLSLPLPVFPAAQRGGGKQDGEGKGAGEGFVGVRLCPRDPRPLPDLLLDSLQGALKACLRACGLDAEEEAGAGAAGSPSPSPLGPTPAQADACAAVAEVLCGSLVRARCSCPHPKFAAEGYNASRLRGIGGSAGSASGGNGSSSGAGGGSSDAGAGGPASHGYSFSGGAGHYEGEEEGGSKQQPGGSAGGAAGSSQAQGWGGAPAPAAFDADAAAASVALEAAALSRLNTQVSPDYHSPAPQPADNTHLHLMRWLRDGQGAGRLAGAVAAAAEVLAAFPGPAAPPSHRARGSVSSRTPDSPSSLLPPPAGADGGVGGISQASGPVAAVCEAVLTLAAGVAEAAAVSWLQQMTFVSEAADTDASAAAAAAAGAAEASVGHCPRFLRELLPVLPQLVGLLQDLNAAGTQANAGPLQGQQGDAAAAASSASGEAAAPFAPFPSSKPAPRLGPAGLALVRCLCALVRCGWPQVVTAAAGLRLHARLLDSLAAFAWHSVLHRAVTDALLACLHDGSAAMRRAALFEAALLSRVVSCGKLGGMPASLQEAFAPGANYPRAGPAAASAAAAEADAALRSPSQAAGAGNAGVSGGPSVCPRVVRVGYTGHLCQLSNAVVSAYARGVLSSSHGGAEPADAAELSGASGSGSSSLAALVKSHGDWWRFVDRELACANVQRGVLLGGLPPDTAKSGNVGTAGDAQARPAAVDEVAALEAKEGAGGGGDRLSDDGSGSDDEEEEAAERRRRQQAEEERERGGEEVSLVGGPSRKTARAPSPPSPRSSDGEGEGQEGASDGGEDGEEEGSTGQQPQQVLYGSLDDDEEGQGEGEGQGAVAAASAGTAAAADDDGFAAAAFESAEWGQAQPAQGQDMAGSSADSTAAWDFGSSHPSGAGPTAQPAAVAGEEDWGFGIAAAPAPGPGPSDAASAVAAPAPAAASFDDFGFGFDEGGASSGGSAGTTAQSNATAVASTDEFGFDAGSELNAASRQKGNAQPTADDFSWG